MELFNFIFKLGVVFAIFGFIWGIIQIGYQLLRAGVQRTIREEYAIKLIKYFFLVDVTFLFCVEENGLNLNQLITTALILLTYFIGKLQNQQNRVAMFQMVTNGLPKNDVKFDLRSEITIISLAILFFIGFIFFPEYSKNPISLWFKDSIHSIEEAAVFGFIFKVIGFFFLLSMIIKMVNAISLLITGSPLTTSRVNFNQESNKKNDSNRFDDFEEIE